MRLNLSLARVVFVIVMTTAGKQTQGEWGYGEREINLPFVLNPPFLLTFPPVY